MTDTELRVWAEAHAPKEGAPGSPLASAVLRLLKDLYIAARKLELLGDPALADKLRTPERTNAIGL